VSSADKVHLLDGRCTTLKSTAEFSPALKAAFSSATHETKFSLANQGQTYQDTDVIEVEGLPWRRLILGAHCDDRWIIYYEHGGFAPTRIVLTFVGDSSPKFVWGGTWIGPAKNLDELRERIKLGKVYEDAHYF
jgi:hypothetical protein